LDIPVIGTEHVLPWMKAFQTRLKRSLCGFMKTALCIKAIILSTGVPGAVPL